MEAYTDYQFYKTEYKGKSISESDFDRLALEATFFIKHCCQNRITSAILSDGEVGDLIKRATCAVAEVSQKSEERDGISSESVGNTSVTYKDTSNRAVNASKRNAVSMYLGDTGLLYQGVY